MKLKLILPLAICMIAFSSCHKEDGYILNPLYDLDVPLHNVTENGGAGFIKFRQNPDTARLVTLETGVTGMKPNHSYLVQRAVNPIGDATGCSSNVWLTLGVGLQPMSILTNSQGDGSVNLWRDITGIPRGSAFHIRFQVLNEVTLSPVLASECFDYTVR